MHDLTVSLLTSAIWGVSCALWVLTFLTTLVVGGAVLIIGYMIVGLTVVKFYENFIA